MVLIIIPRRESYQTSAASLRHLVANVIFTTMPHDSSSSKLNHYLLVNLVKLSVETSSIKPVNNNMKKEITVSISV